MAQDAHGIDRQYAAVNLHVLRSLLCAGLVFAPHTSNAADAVSAGSDISVGQRVFEASCAACHGAHGRPDPASAVVQALGLSTGMPGQCGNLSAAEILAVVAYIKTLAPGSKPTGL